jgi:hypothetical protein
MMLFGIGSVLGQALRSSTCIGLPCTFDMESQWPPGVGVMFDALLEHWQDPT